MDVVLGGILHLNVFLRQEEDVSFAFLSRLQGGERQRAANQKGQDHVGEENQVPKCDHGKLFWDLVGLVDPDQCRHSDPRGL